MARVAADALVLFHLGFVLFVCLGGLLALRWPRLAWLHVPCAAWGALVEWTGLVCPLTSLENGLRLAAGEPAYGGGFIARYIVPVLYPDGLTRAVQVVLGCAVVLLNVAVYLALWRRRQARVAPAGG